MTHNVHIANFTYVALNGTNGTRGIQPNSWIIRFNDVWYNTTSYLGDSEATNIIINDT